MPRVAVELKQTGQQDAVIEDKEHIHPNVGQYFYTPQELERLENDPEYLLEYRKRIEYAINEGFALFDKDTEASRMAEKYMRAEMIRRLDNNPLLVEKLTPKWPVGCRYVSLF